MNIDFDLTKFDEICRSSTIDSFFRGKTSLVIHNYENRQYIIYYVWIRKMAYIGMVRISPDYDISFSALSISRYTNIVGLFDDLSKLGIVDLHIISRYMTPYKFINLLGKIEVVNLG